MGCPLIGAAMAHKANSPESQPARDRGHDCGCDYGGWSMFEPLAFRWLAPQRQRDQDQAVAIVQHHQIGQKRENA
jgi:hypothetical protein